MSLARGDRVVVVSAWGAVLSLPVLVDVSVVLTRTGVLVVSLVPRS